MRKQNLTKNQISLILLAFLLLARLCIADTVILKEGQTLTGKILAEKDTSIVVDIGVSVLVIPKQEILEFGYENSLSATTENQTATIQPIVAKTNYLYSTSDSPKTSVEASVKQVAEAVVKISTPSGLGSGFFINKDGYLITNYHVIEKETKIEVTVFRKAQKGFEKRKFKKVKIEAINSFLDLALLKVEDPNKPDFKYVPLAKNDDINAGEKVFAIGNPLGLERTVTDGVISSKNRAFKGLVYIQTNADINPGNSGGPLFNLSGQVIGVTNMGYIFFGGLGFAIPVNYVKNFVENKDAFTYDKDNPNTGFRYFQPAPKKSKSLKTNEKLPGENK